jgi:hypothetical protein
MNHSELKCGLTKRLICASTLTLGQRFNWAMHPYEQRWQTDKQLTTPLKPEFFYQDKLLSGRKHEPLQWLLQPNSQSLEPPSAAAGTCADRVWHGAIRQPSSQVGVTGASALSIEAGPLFAAVLGSSPSCPNSAAKPFYRAGPNRHGTWPAGRFGSSSIQRGGCHAGVGRLSSIVGPFASHPSIT